MSYQGALPHELTGCLEKKSVVSRPRSVSCLVPWSSATVGETRAAFKKLMAQGWTDAIRKLYPTETIYTFWDYFRDAYGRNAGLRIDHFLLSPNLAEQLTAAGVNREVRGWEKSSDHAPVWIELKV